MPRLGGLLKDKVIVATSYIRKCQSGIRFEKHTSTVQNKCRIEFFFAFLDSMSSSYVLDNFYFLGLSIERIFWQIKKLQFGSTLRTAVNKNTKL